MALCGSVGGGRVVCDRGDALIVLFSFEPARLRGLLGDGFGEGVAVGRGESCGDSSLLMSILKTEDVAHGIQLLFG